MRGFIKGFLEGLAFTVLLFVLWALSELPS